VAQREAMIARLLNGAKSCLPSPRQPGSPLKISSGLML
jgi:hypothetical protein